MVLPSENEDYWQIRRAEAQILPYLSDLKEKKTFTADIL